MPILMPEDTRNVLGENAKHCESRSLYFERFAQPDAREDERKNWFEQVIGKRGLTIKITAWQRLLPAFTSGGAPVLYAQLQARLMLNMAGGVMENAGLCLDRFGQPFLPGSAVKGCARRAALAALREWCQPEGQPGYKPSGAENLFTPARAPFGSPGEMLAAIAQVFGWGEPEWADHHNGGRLISDFAWAVGSQLWGKLRTEVRQSLPKTDNFAGSISFLPAYPVDLGKTGPVEGLPANVPYPGTLELDVVTCHHPDYYAGKIEIATDTEEPIPVVFPAVAPGHVFGFALLPLRNYPSTGPETQPAGEPASGLTAAARCWLATGLQAFGLGAKTSAGYGWFDCSEDLQAKVQAALRQLAGRQEKEALRREEEQRQKAADEERRQQKADAAEATKNMSEEEKQIYLLTQLNEQKFLARLDNWRKLEMPEKIALYTLLRGDKKDLWLDLRQKVESGKQKEKARWGSLVQDLFRMAKERKEKMPTC